MSGPDPDEFSRQLAEQSLGADDATSWFERLYVAAEAGETEVPWDRGEPHPLLAEWAAQRQPAGQGERALVVGCGLGFDAELFAGLGYDTVAFDVAETAVATARRRFPESKVAYVTADLLDLPASWREGFDLVVESLTVQALPVDLRAQAIAAVGTTVAPGGTLLVVAAAADGDAATAEPGPPWPLTRADIDAFTTDTLHLANLEHLPSQRWRAEYHRQR